MSLYVCEHRLLIHSGISLDVTLYQRGQIHSLRAAQKSSVSHKDPETSTKGYDICVIESAVTKSQPLEDLK